MSTYADNTTTVFSSYNTHLALGSALSNYGRNVQPPLTTNSLMSLRQQMDGSNHDMVNMLTQQIVTMFNALIQNTNQSYQMLATQPFLIYRMRQLSSSFHIKTYEHHECSNLSKNQLHKYVISSLIMQISNLKLVLVYQKHW